MRIYVKIRYKNTFLISNQNLNALHTLDDLLGHEGHLGPLDNFQNIRHIHKL